MRGEVSSIYDLVWNSRRVQQDDVPLALVFPTAKSKSSSSSSRDRSRQRKDRSGISNNRLLLLAAIMIATLSLRVTRCAARDLPIGPSRGAGGYSGLLGSGQQRVARQGASDLGAIQPSVQQRRTLHDEKKEGLIKKKDTESVAEKLSGGDSTDQTRKAAKSVSEENVTAQKAALEDRSPRFVEYATRQLRRGAGVAISSMGFLSSSTSAFLGDKTALQRWNPTIEALREFLKTTGIDLELSKTLNGRLFHNAVLLQRVQSSILEDSDRRDLVLQRGRHNLPLPSNEEALRFMKYSTAVYGDSMIAAAEMDVCGKFDSRSRLTRARISDHIGVPEEDIVLMDVEHGGDPHHLRHFVAIDHANRQVVLSIRGTFSFSEMVVDAAGFSRPFCGGEAHSEMATMAERVWDVAGLTVLKILRQHKTYGFVITGHSLGAGTATLLNILCHRKGGQLVDGRPTRCFAYAPPPVFTPLEFVPNAVKTCTSYIHEADVVPFLSIDSVRHFFASVGVIEKYTEKAKWLSQVQLSMGLAKPDQALLDDVVAASTKRLPPKAGAPILKIPCASVVWMREKGNSGKYDVKVCDPRRLATLGIFVDPNMLQDHLPPSYEHAFHNLEEEMKSK